jgi:hypothetical protein
MAANDHIRVSDRVKSLIDDRRREGESYDDALERILGGERNLTDGMGFWSDDEADEARKTHERGKQKTIERTERRRSSTPRSRSTTSTVTTPSATPPNLSPTST